MAILSQYLKKVIKQCNLLVSYYSILDLIILIVLTSVIITCVNSQEN